MDKNIDEKDFIYLYFRKTSLKLRVPCNIITSESLPCTKIIKWWLLLMLSNFNKLGNFIPHSQQFFLNFWGSFWSANFVGTIMEQRRIWDPSKHPRWRGNHSGVFCKKGVLKNFAKFTGKHLRQRLFFNKVAGGTCNFIKRETLSQVFSCKFCKIFKNTFFTEPPQWLLLKMKSFVTIVN